MQQSKSKKHYSAKIDSPCKDVAALQTMVLLFASAGRAPCNQGLISGQPDDQIGRKKA